MATLGETLYAARSAREETLEDVARVLRIRPSILQALETGETAALPTGAVTKGFVRTYTKYLGLDDDQAVRLFEEESGSRAGQSPLKFPEIVEPARLPGWGTVIAGFLIFGFAVVSWFTYSNRDALGIERVSELPDRLMKLIKGEQETPDTGMPSSPEEFEKPEPSAASSSNAESMATEAQSGDSSAMPFGAQADLSATETPIPPLSSDVSSVPEPTGPIIVAVIPPYNDGSSEVNDVQPTGQAQLGENENISSSSEPENNSQVMADSEVVASTTVDSEPRALFAGEGTIYGDTVGVPRVVVRALGDSWVQVRDPAGRTVFSRILRTGDIYRVPGDPGLSMIAGSVGDLQFWVDGSVLSPLGEKGRVRRDIPLDADDLKTMEPG